MVSVIQLSLHTGHYRLASCIWQKCKRIIKHKAFTQRNYILIYVASSLYALQVQTEQVTAIPRRSRQGELVAVGVWLDSDDRRRLHCEAALAEDQVDLEAPRCPADRARVRRHRLHAAVLMC